jgi:hypothetical protein
MSTTTEQNKAVIWRFIDAWNSRQPDAFDDLIAPDLVRHCEAIPGVEARNLDQVKELLRQDTMVFPDSVPSGRKAQFDFRPVFRMNTVFVAVRFSAQPSNPATTAAGASGSISIKRSSFWSPRGISPLRRLPRQGRMDHARGHAVCAEAVPWRCHRSLVADALDVRSVPVIEILSDSSFRMHTLTPFARVDGLRITYPPDQATLL